jgi:hypothetical protein
MELKILARWNCNSKGEHSIISVLDSNDSNNPPFWLQKKLTCVKWYASSFAGRNPSKLLAHHPPKSGLSILSQ